MPSRILIVEDEPMLMRAYVHVLRPLGTVIPVGSVTEAVAALKSAAFDLLFTDHHLPDGTSLAVLAAARASSPWARRILLTGDDSIDLEAAVTLGIVHAALQKPFAAPMLRMVAQRLLPAPSADVEADPPSR
jgi:serine/threonine-protein kinase RsbW